ncbi:MAG: caspase family protein [Deltaproteobacteria bacterium]|jgi:hypothetical protein|nr:caspase family protein [Deltaproteobacteria bacterium]
MRKALIVGINNYNHLSNLHGCANDAYSVKNVLERHSDGSVNFGVRPLISDNCDASILKEMLRNSLEELFSGDSDIALFYFSGHGYVDKTGGYLATSECKNKGDGIPLNDIMAWANNSRSKNKIIILDSCNSGSAAEDTLCKNVSVLPDGLTILTAATAEQYATEVNGRGVFTELLVDALNGAAANLVGAVSPGSMYAHIDQSLGPWAQRPVFKTNVKSFVSLRQVQPPIALSELQKLNMLFPVPGFEYSLDPSYEPERNGGELPGTPTPDPTHTTIFATLQNYNRVNIVVPVDAPHMWHAAMNSKACKLTVLGEHYRRLVEASII